MAKSQESNNKSGELICNPIVTVDPVTNKVWLLLTQAEVDRLKLTDKALIKMCVEKYGNKVNISIGRLIFSVNAEI